MHFPGYRYCGPGTDIEASDRAGGPIDALDKCCREHDIGLRDSPASQQDIDSAFAHCANKEGYLGRAFVAAVESKNLLGKIPALRPYLPGAKSAVATRTRSKAKGNLERYYKYQKKGGERKLGQRVGDTEGAGTSGGAAMEQDEQQEAAGAEATGGSGGGGQMPAMNPRPIQTGTVVMHFSRTFRHYIKTGTPTYSNVFDQQWSDIPYQFICASLKPRDWQMINVMSKRWRILSSGFNMEHIIPIINETTTVGGAVKTQIAFNLMPYLETYIDKGYQLPIIHTYYNWASLP